MKITVPVCIASLGFCLTINARAQVPAPPPSVGDAKIEVARSAFQRGVDLFHEGNFEAALAEFQKANQAAPSYRLLYNIAQAYFELHDYVNAVKSYQQYLTDGDKGVPSARKAQVEETIQKLQTRIGTLTIQVKPEGAQVTIDDVPVGTSPLELPVKVNPGPRRISATKAGFTAASQTVTVAGSDKLNIALELGLDTTPAQGRQPIAGLGDNAATIAASATKAPSRTPLFVALTATGVSAVSTGIFGYLAHRAKNDFEKDLNTFGVSPAKLDDDRSSVRRYALITDVAAATTLLAGGVSLYLVLSNRSSGEEKRSAAAPGKLALLPTPNGVALLGGW